MTSMVLMLAACGGGQTDPPTLGTETAAPPPAQPFLFDGAVPRNLILVSIDTLRRDQLARFGGTGNMPFLDGLAGEAVTLEDHTGCSNWTMHAMTCTMRGSDPLEWGFAPRLDLQLQGIEENPPPGLDYLASWLGDSGFHTVLLTTNSVFSERRNNAVGYDDYFLAPTFGNTPAADAGAWIIGMLEDALAPGDVDRWFMHLHLMEPHRPYVPPEAYRSGWDALPDIPYDLESHTGHDEAVVDAIEVLTPKEVALLEQHMRTRYDGDARWLDDQLRDFWADLESRGWLDDALVVFLSDHGEQHFERGYQAHAFTLYKEENDVFAFFWAKGLQPMAWSGPTHATDVAPTLLDLFDVPIPAVVSGRPVGQADPEAARFAFTAGKVGVFQSVRQGNDKLIFGWSDPDDVGHSERFAQGLHQFDVVADPGETNNLFDASSARTQELWSLLEPQVKAAAAVVPDRTVAWPDDL